MGCTLRAPSIHHFPGGDVSVSIQGLSYSWRKELHSPDAHFCESGTYRDVTLPLLQTIDANNANISYLNG